MVFIKRMNNSDTGDATHLGGDNWDNLDKYFDDIDVESTLGKPAKINTKTEVRSSKLVIKNPSNTFGYTVRGSSISNNVNLDLPNVSSDSTLVAAGGTNDWGTAVQTFRSSNIAFRNPANTASYFHVTSAITSNRNVTWPLLAADDTVTLNNFLATLKNKTVNIDENTIKHSTTNAEGDLLIYDSATGKYIRLPRGSDGQVLKTVSGDLAWGNETAVTPTEDVYGNLKSTTGGTKYGTWQGVSTSAGYGLFASLININALASTAYIDTTNGFHGRNWPMSSNTNVGLTTTDLTTIRKLNPELEVCFQMHEGGDNTGSRVYIGFFSIANEPMTNDTEVDSRSGFMLYKKSTETTFKIISNDGTGTAAETSSILTTDSNVHTIKLVADEANSRWGYSLDGAALTYISTSTDIPASTTPLAIYLNGAQEDTTPRNFRLFWAKMKMKERV